MYATVLNALEIQNGSSFLNIGSGSGYLSCLVACLAGKSGVSHGIEVSSQTLSHAKACCESWRQRTNAAKGSEVYDSHYFQLIPGNAFELRSGDLQQSKYDRIYVGAGCPDEKKDFFYTFLEEGGILVVPVNARNELLKVRRLRGNVYTETVVSNVHFAPLVDSTLPSTRRQPSQEPRDEVLMEIQRASPMSLVVTSRVPISGSLVLPMRAWLPSTQVYATFPPHYRKVAFLLLLAASKPLQGRCIASALPLQLWHLVLSYTHRHWFDVPRSEADVLRAELLAERRLRRGTEQRLRLIEHKLRAAEREKELFRAALSRFGGSAALHYCRNGLLGVHNETDSSVEESESSSDEEDDAEGATVAEVEDAVFAEEFPLQSEVSLPGIINVEEHAEDLFEEDGGMMETEDVSHTSDTSSVDEEEGSHEEEDFEEEDNHVHAGNEQDEHLYETGHHPEHNNHLSHDIALVSGDQRHPHRFGHGLFQLLQQDQQNHYQRLPSTPNHQTPPLRTAIYAQSMSVSIGTATTIESRSSSYAPSLSMSTDTLRLSSVNKRLFPRSGEADNDEERDEDEDDEDGIEDRIVDEDGNEHFDSYRDSREFSIDF